jgi:uncharacterized protein YdhG (YjbR/CyaY superfamily)
MKTDYASTEEYIGIFPPPVRKTLNGLRKAILAAAPKATERISYGMPAFHQGETLVYFAAYKNHIGFYPTSSGIRVFKEDLKAYKTSRGTVQFPVDEPLPLKLIQKIVRFRVKEAALRAKKKKQG